MVTFNPKRALATGALTLAGLSGYAGTGFLATQQGQHFISTAAVLTAYTTSKPVNWTGRTCNAVLAVQDHDTARNVSTLAYDAAHLTGRTYLRADVYELLADATSPSAKSRQYLDVALQYAGEDCFGGA